MRIKNAVEFRNSGGQRTEIEPEKSRVTGFCGGAWRTWYMALPYYLAVLTLLSLTGCQSAVKTTGVGSIVPRPVQSKASEPRKSDKAAIDHYGLQVRIKPAEQWLSATATLRVQGLEPGRVELFLNKSFQVSAVRVNGHDAEFSWGDPERRLPYTEPARLLVVHPVEGVRTPSQIELSYSGHISGVISDVNLISDDLIELASYAAYYPMPAAVAGGCCFPFTLTVSLPEAYTVVSRGERTGINNKSGERSETWTARIPGRDIPLFASNNILRKSQKADGVEVSVFFRNMRPADADLMLGEAVASLQYFTDQFGLARASTLQLIYSPREGWGYSRSGFIVLPEAYAMKKIAVKPSREDGKSDVEPPDSPFHGLAHEIAHFWWSLAETTTSHDWLNEALAEYSAARDSGRREGDAGLRAWVNTYARSLRRKPPPVGILETRSSDRYRYTNWYERGALFFLCLEERIGQQAMNRLLRGLIESSSARPLTTEFLIGKLDDFDGLETEWIQGWLESAELAPVQACLRRFQ